MITHLPAALAIVPVLWTATVAASADPDAPVVQLAPFRCAGVTEMDVRPLLQVELRGRLLPETTPAAHDFVLVSVACEDDSADVLTVAQLAGAAVRRRVALAAVPPEARARTVAVAIAETLQTDPPAPATAPEPRPAPLYPPPPPIVVSIVSADDAEMPSDEGRGPAALDLIEPLILTSMTESSRIGVRTRLGGVEVQIDDPTGPHRGDAFVFALDPFLDLAVDKNWILTLTAPVTWSDGPTTASYGRLANFTVSLRYSIGDRLRLGFGSAISVHLGDVDPVQGAANLWDLDRFSRASYVSQRVYADALVRQGRLYLQAEVAGMGLVSEKRVDTLIRAGATGGIAWSAATLGMEYLAIGALSNSGILGNGDRLVQVLILGTRWAAFSTTTVGAHFQLALDQGPNLAPGGVLSLASSF